MSKTKLANIKPTYSCKPQKKATYNVKSTMLKSKSPLIQTGFGRRQDITVVYTGHNQENPYDVGGRLVLQAMLIQNNVHYMDVYGIQASSGYYSVGSTESFNALLQRPIDSGYFQSLASAINSAVEWIDSTSLIDPVGQRQIKKEIIDKLFEDNDPDDWNEPFDSLSLQEQWLDVIHTWLNPGEFRQMEYADPESLANFLLLVLQEASWSLPLEVEEYIGPTPQSVGLSIHWLHNKSLDPNRIDAVIFHNGNHVADLINGPYDKGWTAPELYYIQMTSFAEGFFCSKFECDMKRQRTREQAIMGLVQDVARRTP